MKITKRANKKRRSTIDLDQLYARMEDENMDAIIRAMQKAQPPKPDDKDTTATESQQNAHNPFSSSPYASKADFAK
jgi:hypothetical protein